GARLARSFPDRGVLVGRRRGGSPRADGPGLSEAVRDHDGRRRPATRQGAQRYGEGAASLAAARSSRSALAARARLRASERRRRPGGDAGAERPPARRRGRPGPNVGAATRRRAPQLVAARPAVRRGDERLRARPSGSATPSATPTRGEATTLSAPPTRCG